MNNLFHGFEFIRAYIDDLLILTEGYWTDHVQKLELRLNKLKDKGLKCNIERSFFGKTEMEYLGFWVTRNGVKTTNINLEAITNMKPPTSQKEVCNFIRVVNYNHNMLPRRSHKLAPLTKITSIKRKFKWMNVEKDALEEIKRIVARDTLLTYLYFNKTFKIHTNYSAFQLGAVISQEGQTDRFLQ